VSTYLGAYILGFNISELTIIQVQAMNTYVTTDFPYWNQTAMLLQEVQHEVTGGAPQLTFEQVTKIAEILTERLGRYVDKGDCSDIRERHRPSEAPEFLRQQRSRWQLAVC